MKQQFIYVALAFAMTIAACSKDDTSASSDSAGSQEVPTVELHLAAGMTTRTSMDDTGKVIWHEDDHVSVLTASANYDFAAESIDGSNAVFTGLVTNLDASSDVAKYAVYPYTKGLSLNGTTVSGIVIPTEQHFSEISGSSVSFAQNTNPSIGSVSAENKIQFLNLCGLVRVKVNTTVPLKKITLRSVNGEAVAGTGSADVASGTTEWQVANAQQTITLTKSDASAFAANSVTFTFVVAPGTFENGLEIVLGNDQNGAYTWTSARNVTINRAEYKSFEITAKEGDFEEAVPMPENAWSHYYGADGNCLLLKPGQTSGTLDVQPYVVRTDCKPTAELYPAPKAKGCKVLWKERGLSLDVAVSDDYKTLTVSNVSGYGNASVAIYSEADCSGDILWSYHIWVPEDDPTQLLNYDLTYSDAAIEGEQTRHYAVMPMLLGATKIARLDSDEDTKKAAQGYYYQWGRKDPLGRISGWSDAEEYDSYVEAIDSDSSTPISWATCIKSVSEILTAKPDGKDQTLFMIDYATNYPTMFITSDNDNGLNWIGNLQNANLWGNPKPMVQDEIKSVYDPCPKGYCVAPDDTWWNFTTSGWNASGGDAMVANWGNFLENHGYGFYYKGKSFPENVDFYVGTGRRFCETGTFKWGPISLIMVGSSSGSYYWGDRNTVSLYAASDDVRPRTDSGMGNATCLRCIKYKE